MRSLALIAALALAAQVGPVRAQAEGGAGASRSAPIDRNGVLILIRSALLALDHANRTGNYTVLRDLGSPQFQANSAARLGEIFAAQRGDKLDLSGVAVLEPQLSLLPQIDAGGMMRFAGFFPSVPTQVNFELAFAPVEGQWRLFGLSVRLGSAVPAAPIPALAAPKPKAVPKPQKQIAPLPKPAATQPASPAAP